MYKNYLENVVEILKGAEEEKDKLNHPYVGTEHLLLSILKNDNDISDYLKKYDLTYDIFYKEIIMVVGTSSKKNNVILYTPMLKRVINNALDNAKEDNNGYVLPKHLILSLLEEGEGIGVRLLVGMNVDIDKIYEDLNKNIIKNKKSLDIYEIGVLLNDYVDDNEVVVGRGKEIDLIIETLLRKKKNNPILLGDAGVGKTAIVEELTRRIKRREVPDSLYDAKIVSLEMGSLVSGTKYRGEFEEKLTKIIKELESNPNIILFIDEIHSMVNAGGAEGAITAGDIFKPYLARGTIKCIGATTKEEYLKYFSKDKALMRRFEIINIDEPTKEEVKDILLKVKKEYEYHHKVKISNNIIDKIIYYTDNFITNKKYPDKAIDFLDSVCSRVKVNHNYLDIKKELYDELNNLDNIKKEVLKNNDYEKALAIYKKEEILKNKINNYNKKRINVINEKDIIDVLEDKTNIILSKDKLKFLNIFKDNVNKELYNMDKYIKELVSIIKESIISKKNILKILLEGNKYLGKSSIVRILSNSYPKCNFIKIDLKEYTNELDINKLIGTYIGYNDNTLLSSLKSDLFTIILFDNYSYAHRNIKELIKEILKDNYIMDNKNEKIYFNNTYIFITDDIKNNNQVGFSNNIVNNDNELLNLVDYKVSFSNLEKDTLINYLNYKKVKDINYILNNSNYELDNYKNINSLIKKERILINN